MMVLSRWRPQAKRLDTPEHVFVFSVSGGLGDDGMDIGKQRRIIQVEPEPLTVPIEPEPAPPTSVPEPPPVQVPEPAPAR